MPDLRVLVVDDEPLVREGLRDFFQQEPGVTLVGECANGVAALEYLQEHDVDLLFLDIEMPELDGLGVAEALVQREGPAVVFVTAYNEHAIKAFELNAVDYLLKPFDRRRFQVALERARARHLSGRQVELSRQLSVVLGELERSRGFVERVLVKSEGRIRLVPVEEIDWIEAADNYLRLHVGNEYHLIRETIAGLESRLDPRRFVRIHRSAIANISRIRELQPTFNGEYTVLLRSGARLTLSRSYRDGVRSRLGTEF